MRSQTTTLIASFLFALMALFVKLLSPGIPPAEILFIRALISILVIVAVLASVYRRKARVRNMNMLVVRGLFGGLAVLMFFTAISRIPLSSAVLLANSYPIFAVLFSAILIKERPNLDSLAVVLLACGGMFLVLDPRFGQIDIGYLLGVGAAVFGGIAVTAIRELRKTDSSWMIALSQMVGAAFFAFFMLPSGFRVPSPGEWGLLVLVGVVGTAAQLAFTRPFRFLPTAEGSMVAPVYTVFVVVLSVIFLKETLTPRFIAGALLIFGSIIYLIAREEIRIRKSVL
jgi:drug/metabolite transporter (DMT)-like permease